MCDEGRGVGESGLAVYLDFADAIKRLGADVIRARYGNLFDMYTKITDENPYQVPMRIYPAIHYTMGGLWVDYNLMSTIPGPARARRGELLRPRRQPPRRQRADAGPGRRLLRHPVHAGELPRRARRLPPVTTDHDAFKEAEADVQARIDRLLAVKGTKTPRAAAPRARRDPVGRRRHGAQRRRPAHGARRGSRSCARSSGRTSRCRATPNNLNKNLEYAGRVADYLEFAELLALDALHRTESCGGHFREESQTPDGEALRDDEHFTLRRGVGVHGRRAGSRRCTRSR